MQGKKHQLKKKKEPKETWDFSSQHCDSENKDEKLLEKEKWNCLFRSDILKK